MNTWLVGIYEDKKDLAFIAIKGGSICTFDNLSLKTATAIVNAHNNEHAALKRLFDRGCTCWDGDVYICFYCNAELGQGALVHNDDCPYDILAQEPEC